MVGDGEQQKTFYFIPSILPSFLCRPALDVGIPVAFAILRFAAVTPVARLNENDRPGIPVFEPLRFCAMLSPPFL